MKLIVQYIFLADVIFLGVFTFIPCILILSKIYSFSNRCTSELS